MIEIVATLFVLFITWFVGVIYGFTVHKRIVDRRIHHFVDHITEQIEKDVIHISLERHEGVIYVYDLTTKAFMAQGKTGREVEKVLQEKFPGKTFAASTKDIVESGLRNESI
jgi:hypothetical protein